jgi:hypothetical protein
VGTGTISHELAWNSFLKTFRMAARSKISLWTTMLEQA